MTSHWIPRAAVVCSLALLAACGGGAGTSNVPAQGAQQVTKTGSAIFTVKIPQRTASGSSRTPKYLTPAVKGIDFTVASGDGSAPNARGYVFYPLSPQATYCASAGGTLTCTLAVQAIPGTDLITVNTYDGPTPYYYTISTGYITATIAAGGNTPVNIVTNGTPVHVSAALDNPYPVLGSPVIQPVHVTAADGDNYIIIGPYDAPLALSISDTSAHTSLSTHAVASSSVVPNLVWDGVALSGSATLQVQSNGPGASNNGGPFNGFATFNPGGSGIVTSPSSLLFAHAGSSAQTVTISGPGTTPPYAANPSISDTHGDPKCSGIVSVTGSSPTFTITPLSPGTCWLMITSGSPVNGNVPVTVSP